jgi:hypothetical protein
MKKIIALFALVAFLGIATAPAFAANITTTVEVVDKEKDPKEKSEKSEKKADCTAKKEACTSKEKKADCGPK